MKHDQDPITNACRLLREAATELQCGHTLSTAPHDWTGEPEAKAAYDEHHAAADALEAFASLSPVATVFTMEALVPGGGVKYHAEIHKPVPAGTKLYAAPQPAVAAGWVSVDERLPEWVARDDTPCFINNKEVPPTLTSETVLVALKGGGVRTDKLTTIEGKSDGWWHTYGERVVAWQKTPLPPAPSTEG